MHGRSRVAVCSQRGHNSRPIVRAEMNAGPRMTEQERVPEQQPAPEQAELRNTLYRRLTRGHRRLTPARMLVYRIAVVVGWNLVRLAWRSCRLQPMLGLDAARDVVRESKAVL